MKGTFIGLLINNPAKPFFSLCVCAPCALTDWHCYSTRFTWRWEPTYNIDIMVIWWNAQPGRWFLGLKIGHLVFHHLWRKKSGPMFCISSALTGTPLQPRMWTFSWPSWIHCWIGWVAPKSSMNLDEWWLLNGNYPHGGPHWSVNYHIFFRWKDGNAGVDSKPRAANQTLS